MDIIGNLRRFGINTTNTNIATQQIIKKTEDWEDQARMVCMYEELFNQNPGTSFAKETQILLRYAVHEAVRTHNNNECVVYENLIKAARERTAKFFAQFSYWKPDYVSQTAPAVPMQQVSRINEFTQQMETVSVPVEKARKRAGESKSDLAYAFYVDNHEKLTPAEIKQHFIAEIGLSKAGANTYYTNCKNKHRNG